MVSGSFSANELDPILAESRKDHIVIKMRFGNKQKKHIHSKHRKIPQENQQMVSQKMDKITYILRGKIIHPQSEDGLVANKLDDIQPEGAKIPQYDQPHVVINELYNIHPEGKREQ